MSNRFATRQFLKILFVYSVIGIAVVGVNGRRQQYYTGDERQMYERDNYETMQPAIDANAERSLRNAKAHEVIRHMNLSVNPCKDFYEFACGNWIVERKKILIDEGGDLYTTSVQKELELKVNLELQLLLQERVKREDTKSAIKVKQFYEECTSAARGSVQQHSYMLDFAKLFGGLPGVPRTNWAEQNSWIRLIALLRYKYGLDILIGLEIDSDMEISHRKSIYLTEPKDTLIPMELCSEVSTKNVDIRDDSYEAIKRNVSTNMQSWFSISDNKANIFASEVVRFEFEICRGMHKEPDDDSANAIQERRRRGERAVHSRIGVNRVNSGNGKMYLHQLTQKFENVINFKQFVDTSLNTSMNEPVYMRSEFYFQHLKQTLKKSSRATMANYIMYRALYQFHLPNNKATNDRLRYCVVLTNRHFPKVLGDMYNRKFLHLDAKSNLGDLFTEIKETFRRNLRNDWLDDRDVDAVKQKLSQLNLNFPIYQNLDMPTLRWNPNSHFWTILELVMQYNAEEYRNMLHNSYADDIKNDVEAPDVQIRLIPKRNEIISGLGLLQPPYYHYIYGNSLKYSVIGQHIARALITAFDEQGWRSSPASESHWREYTIESFRNRSECFRTQYSNYLHNNPQQFSNSVKLREIIDESSGLNIAFKAYVNWLSAVEPHERDILIRETLPRVNFSNTQLFFINFAQSRCTTNRDEQLPFDFLPLDLHTKERYDVNGHLANSMDFALEFNCPIGTEMNPADKCMIY